MTRRQLRIIRGIQRTPMEFPVPQPTTPLSSNVVPVTFDSWQQAKRGIGHPAIVKVFKKFGSYKCKPHRNSAGVIWRGRAYWWSSKGYYRRGPANGPRRPLKHEIWEFHNRKKMPPMHEIFFRDRNRNNFSPANLEMLHKGDLHLRCIQLGEVKQISREESGKIAGRRWTKRARVLTNVLLNRFNQNQSHEHSNTISALHGRRTIAH